MLRQRSDARFARSSNFDGINMVSQETLDENKENNGAKQKRVETGVKRDFFGRVIVNDAKAASSKSNLKSASKSTQGDDKRVWVSFHEGYSNAVRKPITLKGLMDSL